PSATTGSFPAPPQTSVRVAGSPSRRSSPVLRRKTQVRHAAAGANAWRSAMSSTALPIDTKAAKSSNSLLRDTKILPATTKPRSNRKRWMLSGAVAILAIAAVVYGHRWWTVGRFVKTTDDAYVRGDVTVIAPKVAGFISRVVVADNQPVHAGDLLVK